MKILVINAGSSSLKYQLIDMDGEQLIAKGICERIGIDGKISGNTFDGREFKYSVELKNHTAAFLEVEKVLTSTYKVIDDLSEISAVGHRIVQGGSLFKESVLVDEDVIAGIESLCDLAPLHNAAHIQGIRACREVFGEDVPEVVVFDNAFHSTMPPEAFLFPLPYEYYEKYKVRRYGFHGTSHRFVSARCAEVMGVDLKDIKLITCHLGNGSSITAIKDGKVIDTSMGLTPLDGFIMGSRCGSIDPAIVPFIMEKENIPASEMGNFMNKQCGLLGVSEVSSDLRDVMAAVRAGNKQAKLAYDILCYGIKKYIGSYAAAMNGLDCVVFTAGIGENTPEVRAGALEEMDYLGIRIDPEKNANVKKLPAPCDISADGSRVRVYVIPTNEELVIASDTEKLVSAL